MKIPSFVWIGLIVVLGAGFLILLSNNKGNDIKVGELPVQVEVFSDYNCPHCADFSPFVTKVKETFGDKVNVQEKHLPFLATSSSDYAYAAEAARLQEKFEEFNTSLFAWSTYKRNPSNTTYVYTEDDKSFYSQNIDITLLAERLGLNVEKFNEDRKSTSVIKIVQDQKTDAVKRLGTTATPSVFIYGERFDMSSYEDLQNKVQELINSAESKTQQ